MSARSALKLETLLRRMKLRKWMERERTFPSSPPTFLIFFFATSHITSFCDLIVEREPLATRGHDMEIFLNTQKLRISYTFNILKTETEQKKYSVIHDCKL